MTFNPFAVDENSTKILIVNVLYISGPLNAKKVHAKLKEHGAGISYQAAHKALKKMVENEVLTSEEGNFSINPDWISNMKSFISSFDMKPNSIKDIFSKLDSGKTVSFTVNNDMEMGYFVLDFAHHFNDVKSPKDGPMILNFHFMWTILPLSARQFMMLKEIINKRGVYATSHENSIYEEIMKRHWENAGAKVAINVPDCASTSEVIILGEYIINIFWNPDHLKMNLEFTRAVKDEKSLDYNEFYKVLGALTKTEFVIIKSKEAAEYTRKKSLSYFK